LRNYDACLLKGVRKEKMWERPKSRRKTERRQWRSVVHV